MSNLKNILQILREKKNNYNTEYFIPESWILPEYTEYVKHPSRAGEVNVNPYSYMEHQIENIFSMAEKDSDRLQSTDLPNSIIYSMLPRMFTAWWHYDSKEICEGTILKAICLLPYLKSMNVNLLYLLPFFQVSDKYKKGELGCPYSIKNIYQLDERLHDNLLGDYSQAMLESEFKAFTEACHMLGIKVMVDFAFRTVARDNDLLIQHPDWFYWINLKDNDTFRSPVGSNDQKELNEKAVRALYESEDINKFLSFFTVSPDRIDTEKWAKVKEKHKATGENILDLIQKEFAITTAPGFSDVINDSQPPWTDVTYLKYYSDTHELAKEYISPDQAPYILQDAIKLSLYHGRQPNSELWEYIINVIPYYQTKFGIDGARIDMGHALPNEINMQIVSKAREIDNSFIFWSEEFHSKNSTTAKNAGFDFISGLTWGNYQGLETLEFNKELFEALETSCIPIAASMETPDTPRAAHVFGYKKKIEILTLLNWFLPNSVPLINNGMELMEVQPMNLGLGNTEQGRFVLDKADPMYGKLAFFDRYCLHWLNEDRHWMQQLLKKAIALRKRFSDIVSLKENYVSSCELDNEYITAVLYYDVKKNKGVFVLINRNLKLNKSVKLHQVVPKKILGKLPSINVAYKSPKIVEELLSTGEEEYYETGEIKSDEIIHLAPGVVLICEIN